MTLTDFAGLEALAPGDPLSKDSFRFQSVNPGITDRFLRIGATTHKHDAHAALANPSGATSVTQAASGGSIAGSLTIYSAFTLVDAEGGETLPSAPTETKTPAVSPSPQGVPTAVASYAAGSLLANNFSYGVTVTDGKGGETELSPVVNVLVEPGHTHAEVTLTALKEILEEVTLAGGAEWRLWRSQAGGPYDLLATGVGAEFVDKGETSPDCNVSPPSVSTMLGANELKIEVPNPAEPAAEYFRLYLSTTPTFTSPSLVAQYPISEVAKVLAIKSLALAEGAPPLVSTAITGADKIDPDTDLIEWHWKRPVAKASLLPTEENEVGDVRASSETGALYLWTVADEWVQVPHLSKVMQEHSWALEGAFATGKRPGFFIDLAAGQTKEIIGVLCEIDEGTEAELTFYHNGVAITELTAIKVPKAGVEVTLVTPLTVAAKDKIQMEVVSITAEPKNLSATMFIQSTSD